MARKLRGMRIGTARKRGVARQGIGSRTRPRVRLGTNTTILEAEPAKVGLHAAFRNDSAGVGETHRGDL